MSCQADIGLDYTLNTEDLRLLSGLLYACVHDAVITPRSGWSLPILTTSTRHFPTTPHPQPSTTLRSEVSPQEQRNSA